MDAGRRSATPQDASDPRPFTHTPCPPNTRALGHSFPTPSLPVASSILAGTLAFSSLITHHQSLITAFLIYGPAIRIPRNSLKT
jgi:hypothetical protein